MSIRIRPAIAEDCPLLTDLSMRSKQSNGYDDAFMQACREELTVTDTEFQAGEWWVAEGGDRHHANVAAFIVGCVCLVDRGDKSGEVSAFFIDPDWQRRGIGRQLWKKLLERAHESGIRKLVLDADPHAAAFYARIGFSIVGEKPSGSIAGRMLPHMAIEL